MDTEGPIVIHRCPTPLEASMLVARLNAEGVNADLEPNESYQILSHMQFITFPGGVGIVVPPSQEPQARAALEAILRDVERSRLEHGDGGAEGGDELPTTNTGDVPPCDDLVASSDGQIDILGRSRATIVAAIFLSIVGLAPIALVKVAMMWREVSLYRKYLDGKGLRQARGDLVAAGFITLVGLILTAIFVAVGVSLIMERHF